MDHPAIFLDSKFVNTGDADNASLCVLAISEIGICYLWHGKSIDELCISKPTKISVPSDDEVLQKHKGAVPNVIAGKLQSLSMPATGHLFLAYGLLIKPSFEKVLVQSGLDVKLNVSQDGILLPVRNSQKTRKTSNIYSEVTALDRSNIEGALGPVPKMLDLVDGKSDFKLVRIKDEDNLDTVTLCMEDKLRSLGVVGSKDDKLSSSLFSKYLKGVDLDSSTPPKKVKAAVLSLEPSDAFDLAKALVGVWKSRSHSSKHVLPWICCILVYHSDYIKSNEPQFLDSLYKLATVKAPAVNTLLQLSGRLQLVSAQIDKAVNNKSFFLELDEHEDESEDEDVDEVIYGVDDDSTGSDSDD